jgi:5-methyltetrahydrofolate--homocysteine methyltransferase
MIQRFGLTEAQVRGERFVDHDPERHLERFVDLLCLTQPERVTSVHRQFLSRQIPSALVRWG